MLTLSEQLRRARQPHEEDRGPARCRRGQEPRPARRPADGGAGEPRPGRHRGTREPTSPAWAARSGTPWQTLRSSVDDRFDELSRDTERRRAKAGVRKAERAARRAEEDAAPRVGVALFVLDRAEYAVIEAALARANADEAAASAV